MIAALRVDERLIHGQVAVVWSRYLGINRIVVANDDILNDKMQIMALKMSVPEGIKPFFVSVDKAVALMNNPRSQKLKIFVIVNKPEDALKIVNNVKNIPLVNLGNYGRMGSNNIKAKMQLSKNVFITEKDKGILKELVNTGVKINVQPVPSDPDVQLKDLL